MHSGKTFDCTIPRSACMHNPKCLTHHGFSFVMASLGEKRYMLLMHVLVHLECVSFLSVFSSSWLRPMIVTLPGIFINFNCWFSFAPVFQWCCSTPQGSPGVDRGAFLSGPRLCFVVVFVCGLFVSRDGPLVGWEAFTRTEQLYVLSHDRS